jgi:IS5 family transposase
MYQISFVCLDDLVAKDHEYRKFANVWSFNNAEKLLSKIKTENNNQGFGVLRLFKCLLLQFMENLSDRDLARYISENTACKWFCGFDLTEATPEFTVFTKFRTKVGTHLLSEIFADLKIQLQKQGLMSEVFTFVDSAHLIAKAKLWEERDKALSLKYEKLNNETLPKVSHDKQARIGAKGKNKYWYGYKQHTSVDMQSGLINKVAITPANVTDANGYKHVAPKTGATYADKGYCIKPCQNEAKRRGLHLAAIKTRNMKTKNKDLDSWYTKLRAPYERVFSQREQRVRYVGIAKNQFAAFMFAIGFNLKRIVSLNMADIHIT